MRNTITKNYYAVLGVESGADDGQVREAYLSRMKVVHPDRFDPQTQPQEWKKANEMLAELNEAYAALRDRASRAEYENAAGLAPSPAPARPRPARPEEKASPPLPLIELKKFSPGQARFAELPPEAREKMLRRQEGQEPDQYRFTAGSRLGNGARAIFFGGWFVFLFYLASGPTLAWPMILVLSAITLIAGLSIADNLEEIAQHRRSALRPALYITPIYIIKTGFDILEFWPIWSLSKVGTGGDAGRGGGGQRGLSLAFESGQIGLIAPSEKIRAELVNAIKKFRERILLAAETGDAAYFARENDFAAVSRENAAAKVGDRKTDYLTHLATIGVSVILLALAILFNHYHD